MDGGRKEDREEAKQGWHITYQPYPTPSAWLEANPYQMPEIRLIRFYSYFCYFVNFIVIKY